MKRAFETSDRGVDRIVSEVIALQNRLEMFLWRKYLRELDDAHETAVVAVEKACGNAAAYDERRGSVKTWLFAIGRNLAIDRLRRQLRSPEVSIDDVAEEDMSCDGPEAALETMNRRELLRAWIAELDEPDRSVSAGVIERGEQAMDVFLAAGLNERQGRYALHRSMVRLQWRARRAGYRPAA